MSIPGAVRITVIQRDAELTFPQREPKSGPNVSAFRLTVTMTMKTSRGNDADRCYDSRDERRLHQLHVRLCYDHTHVTICLFGS